jgi:hypothetical protein
MEIGISDLSSSMTQQDQLFHELFSDLNAPDAAEKIPSFEEFQISGYHDELTREEKDVDLDLIMGTNLLDESAKLFRAYSDQEIEELGISEEEFCGNVL